MKRLIISLLLILVTGQFIYSQDLNRLMADLAKEGNVERQVVDQSMLKQSLQGAASVDSTGMVTANMPSFVRNLSMVDVLNLNGCTSEVKAKFSKQIEEFKDGDGYETLLRVKDGEDNIRMIFKRNEDKVSEVFFLVMDEEDIVIVKMTGEFNESDLQEIIKEQSKKNK